ncbi:piggyBac transposable element-derived protein 4-like [Gigantopelta aegis]|uniref:piggyBac transposable element-derived protein 4-like n=1 Tax=Gigantopelta aegis TaxID=1735272 RepID=UPI001B887820|nr:piggyBac transposable element-derived protein 4-like [Gigantopelta aegis]
MPYGQFSLDESMIKFKGRLGFRQYMPAKPIKWGVKMWSLCEADTGYLYNFQIYTGKDQGVQEKGLSHRVVMDLCTPLFGSNAHVYMDNFYSGIELFHDLRVHGVFACGTIRANRKGLPIGILPKNTKLEKHQYKVAQKDDLTCCIWQDTKPVLFLSNFHSPDNTGTVSRRNNARQKVIVMTPAIVSDYQINMGGVDRMDQMIHYYMIKHRSRKWWRRIFFSVAMSVAHNAYICAKDEYPVQSMNRWPNFQDFIEDLSEGLIGDTRAKKAIMVCNVERPVLEHKIEKNFTKRKVC